MSCSAIRRARNRRSGGPKGRFQILVGMMMEHDLELAQRERTLVDAGHKISLDGIANG